MYIMKRYKLIFRVGTKTQERYMRAVNVSSLIAQAEDWMKQNYTIDSITILDSYGDIVEILK